MPNFSVNFRLQKAGLLEHAIAILMKIYLNNINFLDRYLWKNFVLEYKLFLTLHVLNEFNAHLMIS